MASYVLRAVTTGRRIVVGDVNVNAEIIEDALNSFPGGNIQPNTILGTRIKDGSLRGSEAFTSGSVDGSKLASLSVITGKFDGSAVTEPKLANWSVVTGMIALLAVGVAQLAAGIMRVKTSTYVGNTESAHTITGVGFTPTAVFVVKSTGGTACALRTADMTGTNNLGTGGVMPSGILSFDDDGFTVGTNLLVNDNTVTFCYFAIRTT